MMHFVLGQKAYLIQALSLLASGIYLQGVFFSKNWLSWVCLWEVPLQLNHPLTEFPTSGNWSLWLAQRSGVFGLTLPDFYLQKIREFFQPIQTCRLKKIHTQTQSKSRYSHSSWSSMFVITRKTHGRWNSDPYPILFEKDHQLLKGIQKQFGEHNKKTVRIIGIALGFYTRVPLTPIFEGQTPQNKGHLGSRCIYIYIYIAMEIATRPSARSMQLLASFGNMT